MFIYDNINSPLLQQNGRTLAPICQRFNTSGAKRLHYLRKNRKRAADICSPPAPQAFLEEKRPLTDSCNLYAYSND
jgi:hypothetical protein